MTNRDTPLDPLPNRILQPPGVWKGRGVTLRSVGCPPPLATLRFSGPKPLYPELPPHRSATLPLCPIFQTAHSHTLFVYVPLSTPVLRSRNLLHCVGHIISSSHRLWIIPTMFSTTQNYHRFRLSPHFIFQTISPRSGGPGLHNIFVVPPPEIKSRATSIFPHHYLQFSTSPRSLSLPHSGV